MRRTHKGNMMSKPSYLPLMIQKEGDGGRVGAAAVRCGRSKLSDVYTSLIASQCANDGSCDLQGWMTGKISRGKC